MRFSILPILMASLHSIVAVPAVISSSKSLNAKHVLIHTTFPNKQPSMSPHELQEAMQGYFIARGVSELVIDGVTYQINTEDDEVPSDIAHLPFRIEMTTQISYSNTAWSRFYIAPSNISDNKVYFPHDKTVFSALRGSRTSVLLSGGKGTGAKSLLLKALTPRCKMLALLPGYLYAAAPSQPHLLLRQFFAQALLYQYRAAIIYIDDVDALYADEHCAETLTHFLKGLSDRMESKTFRESYANPELILVGRVQNLDGIAEHHQRHWEYTLEVPTPSFETRLDMVSSLLPSWAPEHHLSLAQSLAGLGLVEAVSRIRCAQRPLPEQAPQTTPQDTDVNTSTLVAPADVVGHSKLLERLREMVSLSFVYAEALREYRLTPDIGVLMHGPPGTGKTLLVRRLAKCCSHRLVTIKLTDIICGFVGTGEKALMATVQEAKRLAPTILFIDEFQALFVSRESGGLDDMALSSTLAGCFDDLAVWNKNAGEHSLVLVVAATNEPWAVDKGFLRPGRFDVILYVGPLRADERAKFLTETLPTPLAPELLEDLTKKTAGFSGADFELLLIRANQLLVEQKDQLLTPEAALIQAIDASSPTSSQEELLEYLQWHKKHCKFRYWQSEEELSVEDA